MKAATLPLLLLLLAVGLLNVNAVVLVERGHPHPRTRQAQVNQCKASLASFMRKGQAYCLAYLNGRKPSPSTTVVLPASTVTSTSTASATASTQVTTSATVTTRTTLPNASATSTIITTVTSTVTDPPQPHRRDSVAQTAVDAMRRRSHPRQPGDVASQFAADIVTDACLLLVYGRVSSAATTTQLPLAKTVVARTTTATTSTSISTALTTLVVTDAPTTTLTTSTTTTTTTTTTVAPTPVVRDGGFEGPDDTAWSFNAASGIDSTAAKSHSGSRFAFLQGNYGNSDGVIRQTIAYLVVGQTYTITFFVRPDTLDRYNPGGAPAYFGCYFDVTASNNNAASGAEYNTLFSSTSATYTQASITLQAASTSSELQFRLSCAAGTRGYFDLDDVSIAVM